MRRSLAALLLSLVVAPAASRAEVRGLWVVRTALSSPQAVDAVVDQAAVGGFNALLVQVRGRGDAFYRSSQAPRSVLLEGAPPDFDPLGRLIHRARGRGLAVHGWVNVLLTAHFGQPMPAGHVVREHPEWVMVPRRAAAAAYRAPPRALLSLVSRARDSDVEGYYLSPSAPGVGAHLEAVVRELVRGYPLDGLHLDFIRYPGPDYDHSRSALDAFARALGRSDVLGAPAAAPEAWAEFRRRELTALAERLGSAARAERPGILLSAAVVPDEAQALHHKYQSWPAWISTRLVDVVCPMTYTPDRRLFRQQVDRARDLAGAGRVWAGVGAYRMPLEGTVEKIREARAAGAGGIVVFSHESFAAGEWQRLRESAFPAVVAETGDRRPSAGGEPATERASPR